MALIDTGAQVSTITWISVNNMGMISIPWNKCLFQKGWEDSQSHYLGYIAAIIRIPPIKDYEKYVPMLVLKSFSPFSSWVPVQLGTMVLDRAMAKIMVEELACASSMWCQTYMSTMVTANVASTVEQGGQETPFINTHWLLWSPLWSSLWLCKSEGAGTIATCS